MNVLLTSKRVVHIKNYFSLGFLFICFACSQCLIDAVKEIVLLYLSSKLVKLFA